VTRAALLRTARLLMRGEAMVPASVWAGHRAGDFSATPEPRRARQG
jgi:4-oxalomesaconate tautomerase